MDNANKTRRLLFRLGTVLILIGICIVMMIIGRGHTVYFDNKKLDHEGITYDCPYKVKVVVKGEQVANLKAKERGMATTIGQDFEMTLKITQEKGGDEVEETYSGLPEDVWMSEFVPVATSSDTEEEEVPGGDEFELDDLGDF